MIGHPAANAPAFGWVESIKREGDVLFAKAKQLVPEFVAMLKQGLFKKRSISLYPDGTLRHIGFLGAQPPAVKGLADVTFAHDEEDTIIEFAAVDETKVAQEKRAGEYNIGVKEGGHVTKPSEWADVTDDEFLDPVNYRYPCPDADQTRAAATYWGRERNQAQYSEEERKTITARLEEKKKKFKIGPAFSEVNKRGGSTMSIKDKIKARFAKAVDDIPEEDLTTEPAMFSEAEVKRQVAEATKQAKAEGIAEGKKVVTAEFSEQLRTFKKTELTTYVNGLIAGDGKKGRALSAAKKAGLVEFMSTLGEEETIEFTEGEGDKAKIIKKSPLAAMKVILETLPQDITYAEHATKEKDVGAGDNKEKREKLILEFQEHNKEATYKEAVLAVSKKNPELFKEE